MDSASIMMVGAIVVLVLLSAYFSATETTFTSLNRVRLKTRAESGDVRAARALGLKNRRLQVGGDADLVILSQPDIYHAIWRHQPPRAVIKDGRVIGNP